LPDKLRFTFNREKELAAKTFPGPRSAGERSLAAYLQIKLQNGPTIFQNDNFRHYRIHSSVFGGFGHRRRYSTSAKVCCCH
jgi:hypothetical protein